MLIIIIIMYIHTGIIQTSQSFFYVHEHRLQYTWRIPLVFLLPLLIPLCLPLLPFQPLSTYLEPS
jgi:hypothetical protein